MSQPLYVLLVEDSADDALLLIEALREGGFAPTWAQVQTAEEFRQACNEQPWEIVIADYLLPRFSGLAALRLVQEIGCDLPVIVVSGKAGEETTVEAMRAGARDYLRKDNLVRLAPAVRREVQEAGERRERRRADEERERLFTQLAEQRSLFDAVLRYAPVGISIYEGPTHRFLAVNEHYYAFVAGKGEVIGKTIAEVFPEIVETIIPMFNRVYATGDPFSANEMPFTLQRNGRMEETYFTFTFSVWRDEAGRIRGVISIAIETTEQVRTRQHTEAERLRLQTVLSALPVGVIILDTERNIVQTNGMVERIWGGTVPLPE
ncbi:MAG TPA: response regulator, partial [Armatimonadota bacterium]